LISQHFSFSKLKKPVALVIVLFFCLSMFVELVKIPSVKADVGTTTFGYTSIGITNVQSAHTFQVFSGVTIPPTYSAITTNTTIAGATALLTITVNDALALNPSGTFQFGTNNTGAMVWGSITDFTTTPQTVSTTLVLNTTVGENVACDFDFTNNAGVPATTGISILTTADVQPTPTPTPTPIPTPTPAVGGNNNPTNPTAVPTTTPAATSTPLPTMISGGGYGDLAFMRDPIVIAFIISIVAAIVLGLSFVKRH
jgi:hypothetical protein